MTDSWQWAHLRAILHSVNQGLVVEGKIDSRAEEGKKMAGINDLDI